MSHPNTERDERVETQDRYMSALKFVNEWIWNPPAFGGEGKAQDNGLPWHHPYKHDCAEMIVAATAAMRDRCVAKARAWVRKRQHAFVGSVSDELLAEIQSLTLDQVEQEK